MGWGVGGGKVSGIPVRKSLLNLPSFSLPEGFGESIFNPAHLIRYVGFVLIYLSGHPCTQWRIKE